MTSGKPMTSSNKSQGAGYPGRETGSSKSTSSASNKESKSVNNKTDPKTLVKTLRLFDHVLEEILDLGDYLHKMFPTSAKTPNPEQMEEINSDSSL